jgi:hypothetical protein
MIKVTLESDGAGTPPTFRAWRLALERMAWMMLLQHHGGNLSRLAKQSGLDRSHVTKRIRERGLWGYREQARAHKHSRLAGLGYVSPTGYPERQVWSARFGPTGEAVGEILQHQSLEPAIVSQLEPHSPSPQAAEPREDGGNRAPTVGSLEMVRSDRSTPQGAGGKVPPALAAPIRAFAETLLALVGEPS